MRAPTARQALGFLGGLLLAALLSPFALLRLLGPGLVAAGGMPPRQVFLVLAAMTGVLDLVLALGFIFRGWKALAWGLLAGIGLPYLLALLR